MKRRRKLQPVAINPLVVDLSHHNDVADFGKVKAAGIAGIIHKATEAIGFVDNMYAVRRGPAMNAGLLWGAYHFLRPVSIQAQVDFFLKIAAPDNTTLLALDHEDERVLLINGSICAITSAMVIFGNFIPQFFLDGSRLTPLAHYAAGLDLVIGISALLIMWFRRSSVLDQWLLVAVFAMVLELSLVTFFIEDRNNLGSYCIRVYLVITAIVLLAALLSEKAKLYAPLAQSNKLLERERKNRLTNIAAAASSIAHEVRQPLMGITASASAARNWLDRVPPDLDRATRLLTNIEQAGFRANEVLTNVRNLFQDTDHEQESIDVNNLTVEVLQSLHGELNDHDVRTDVELASELPHIIGHRVQLQEVILNLVHNAIDAMASVKVDHRLLRVRTKSDADKAVIVEVEDSGHGIEPQRLGSIFEPFVTTKPKGSGLGLAICSRIIERHGGQLIASSDGKNGALFKIVLPVVTAPSAARAG